MSTTMIAADPYAGCIESCGQWVLEGWTTAPALEVFLNGASAGIVTPRGDRPDVAEAGIPRARHFRFRFATPLWLEDRVVLRLPDNAALSPTPHTSHLARLEKLIAGMPLDEPGLEFGPLDRAVLPKSRAAVSYVDYDDRERLVAIYRDSQDVAWQAIPEIDFIHRYAPTLDEVVEGRRFAWALASHVGEHVADFVGWLEQIYRVLRPDGCLRLALPNRDRSFDVKRACTTFAELAGAHLASLRQPSPRQVLDHTVGVAAFRGRDLFQPEHVGELVEAMRIARCAAKGDHIDVHCSVFTPASFLTCFGQLAAGALTSFHLESLTEGKDEFFVTLRKIL